MFLKVEYLLMKHLVVNSDKYQYVLPIMILIKQFQMIYLMVI